MAREQKKNQFVETKKSNKGLYTVVGILLAAAVVGGGFWYSNKSSDTAAGLTNVGAVSYQNAQFATATPSEADGNIVLDLNQLKQQKAITFNIPGINFALNNGTQFNNLPLLAYVSPKGNIVVATSLCEPCSGTVFHIEGNNLVCNTCGTTWSLDGFQGVSGGCTTYPPETVKYTVDGNKLIIKKADLQNWKPRQV